MAHDYLRIKDANYTNKTHHAQWSAKVKISIKYMSMDNYQYP